MKAYAGIGSRETPSNMLHLAEKTAGLLADEGWILRSGHAPGADQAFERGAKGRAEIFLPWETFEVDVPTQAFKVLNKPSEEAWACASRFHPAWVNLTSGAKSLHARNSHQILGIELNDPVSFVLCWTKEAKEVGGTAQAMRIAKAYNIPIFNLADPTAAKRLLDFTNG